MRGFLVSFSFLSGVAALLFEIIWVRYFANLFGHSYPAVTSVVTIFMLGLGIGSIVFGKIVDRVNPLKIYFFLEIGIGISGLLFPAFFWLISKIYLGLYYLLPASPFILNLARFVLASFSLLIPTCLMGGTIPALAKLFIKDRAGIDRGVGILYFANNFGASLGAFLCGFILLYAFGTIVSSIFAAAINFLIGAAILIFFTKPLREEFLVSDEIPESKAGPKPLFSETAVKIALGGFATASFIALALEVVWTRILTSTFLSSSIYSFSTVLVSFIVGLSFGSFLYTRFAKRIGRPILVLGIIQILIGVAAIFFTDLLKFNYNLFGLLWLRTDQTWFSHVLIGAGSALALILAPTTLMGMNLPLMSRIAVGRLKDLGNKLGGLLFIQTLANTIGSFSAGFILIQLLGLQKSVVLLGSLSVLVGIILMVLASWARKGIRLVLAVTGGLLLGAVLSMTPWKLQYHRPLTERNRVLFYDENPAATVAVREVFDRGDGRFYKRLEIDGNYVAGTEPVMLTDQKILAHLPFVLLGGKAQRVLTVGFGSGATSYTMNLHDVERVNCVEINPAVLSAAGHFTEINHRILNDPEYQVFIEDARSFLQTSKLQFDIISTDCTDISFVGNAGLYSLEYFAACKDNLSPNGIMCAWVPLSNLSLSNLKMIIKTFQKVFPNTSVWYPDNYRSHYIVLIGTAEKVRYNLEEVAAVIGKNKIGKDLAEVFLDDPYKIFSFLLLEEDACRNFTTGARINSDNYPYLEFSAARITSLFKSPSWANNLSALLEAASKPDVVKSRIEGPRDDNKVNAYLKARDLIIKGHIHSLRLDSRSQQAAYQQARKINPDDYSLQRNIARLQADVFRAMAEESLKRNLIKDARNYLEQALETDPGRAVIYNQLGMIMAATGKFSEAENTLKQGLAKDPEVVELNSNLAKIYLQRNINLPEAVTLAQQAVRLDSSVDNLVVLSIAYEKNQRPREALETLEKAVKIYPRNNKLLNYFKEKAPVLRGS